MSEKKKPGALTMFVRGFGACFAAAGFVRNTKGLKRYFIIPFIINALLLGAIALLSFAVIYPFLMNLIPQGDVWYLSALRWIATPILLVLLAFACVILYSITGSIAAAPFNDPLSARVENALTGARFDDRFSIKELFSDMARIASGMCKLLLIILIFNLVILFLNLIPGVGAVIYSALSFASALFFVGFGFFDFPLERRRLVFGEKLKLVWRHRAMAIGLGLGFSLITIVPLVGFLGLNLAAVGATRLFVEHMRQDIVTLPQGGGNDTL